MLNNAKTHLLIFENFQSLHPRKQNDQYSATISYNNSSSSSTIQNTVYSVANQIVNFQSVHPEDLYVFQSELSMIDFENPKRFKGLFRKFKLSLKECNFNVFKYFAQIKDKLKDMQTIEDESNKDFDTLLDQATKSHQTALVEKLSRERERIVREMKLLKIGIKTYISEEDLVKASKRTSRNLKLDWIKNFVRIIPTELQNIINFTFTEKLFDNYVILHYDPTNKSSEMTEREKEKAKDPILFGVIKESRRLYYLGDWIDDYCDLTLDKLLDIINENHKTRKLESVILQTAVSEGESE